jgi:hypothetical protein
VTVLDPLEKAFARIEVTIANRRRECAERGHLIAEVWDLGSSFPTMLVCEHCGAEALVTERRQ